MEKELGLEALDRLIGELARLPGIGRRSAERIALHLIQAPPDRSAALADALRAAREGVGACPVCGALAPRGERCPVCRDERRDRSVLCVVESPEDVLSIERAGGYRGLYHVLGGKLSPLDGIGPEKLRMESLRRRITGSGEIREVILATGADVEGEATATYLCDLLAPLGVRISRIAHGIPVGAGLAYTDPATLSRALKGRRFVGKD